MRVNALTALPSDAAAWIGRATLLAWFIYLLVAPTIGFSWIESWHNEQRAVQVVLLAWTAVAYCLMGLLSRSENSIAGWQFPLWLFAFLGLGLISALQAQYVFAALAEVGMFILLATLVMLTARVVATDVERSITWTRWFALLFATAYVLGVATRYLAAVNLERAIDLDVLILGYANPRFPSALHTVLIPFLALTVIERKELKSLRVAAAVVLAFVWAINLGLGTRGIWFAYVLGIPLTIFLLGRAQFARLFVVLTLTAIAGVALYFLMFSVGPALAGTSAVVRAPTDNMTNVTSRQILWQLSWQSIKSSPWFGIGPMQFAALDSEVGAHPHNWLLQVAAEWGLPALMLVAVAIFLMVKSTGRIACANSGSVSITLALTVGLALGLVDGNLVMPVSQSAVALLAGLFVATSQSFRQPLAAVEATATSGVLLVVTAFSCIVAIGVVSTYAANTFRDQPSHIERFQRSHPGAWLVPRFWEQGNL